MNIIREIIQNALATPRLQRRYRWLNTLVGVLGTVIGLRFLLSTAQPFAKWYLDYGPGVSQANRPAWLIAFLLAIPVIIYAGCVLVAGLFAAAMVLRGKFTRSEAIYYALLSRYPDFWFKR